MGQHWPIRLSPTVNVEVMIELHAALHRIHIDLEHVGAFLTHGWVELLVPGCEQGVGDIQPLPIQAA